MAQIEQLEMFELPKEVEKVIESGYRIPTLTEKTPYCCECINWKPLDEERWSMEGTCKIRRGKETRNTGYCPQWKAGPIRPRER